MEAASELSDSDVAGVVPVVPPDAVTLNTATSDLPFRVVAVMMMFPALTPTGTVR